VVVPRIHWRYTTDSLLVQDFLDGRRMSEWLDSDDFDRATGTRLARTGADAILFMVFELGQFHADPHPGNVLLLGDGRLGLLDFGMVGRLGEARRIELAALLAAVVRKNEEALTDLLQDWSQDGNVDTSELGADVAEFVGRYHGVPLGQLDASALLADLASLMRENGLWLPPDIAMLLKVFVTLEGLGRRLDPDFQMARHVEPFAAEQARALFSPRAITKRGAQDLAHVLAELPRDLRRLMSSARRGRMRLDVDLDRLDDFGRQLDRSANRLTVGMITAALIVGTAVALTVTAGPKLFGLPVFGALGFASSILIGIGLLFSIMRSGSR
jgi:ubiquinone biosynthesis protein